MEFSVSLGVIFAVLLRVQFAVPFAEFLRVTFRMFFLTVPRTRLRGQRFVMHFVGQGVGFLGRILVIVFPLVFLIVLVIGIQRLLQLFEFGGLYVRFGHRFDRFRPLFGLGLRFFVLGLGQLFGERCDFFVRKTCAIRGVRVC